MTAGLIGSYGTFGSMLGRFVYPTEDQTREWLFVCPAAELAEGQAIDFVSPSGVKIVITRQGAGTANEDYLALSSVCPHLGCRVHWEGPQNRFFCPCHNGAFDKVGKPIAGPPLSAGQSLMQFPLKVENGLLYLEAPVNSLVQHSSPKRPASEGMA